MARVSVVTKRRWESRQRPSEAVVRERSGDAPRWFSWHKAGRRDPRLDRWERQRAGLTTGVDTQRKPKTGVRDFESLGLPSSKETSNEGVASGIPSSTVPGGDGCRMEKRTYLCRDRRAGSRARRLKEVDFGPKIVVR